jgi:hypothetical protein
VSLARDVQSHLDRTGIPPTTFGWHALGDKGFIIRLRQGMCTSSKVEAKVRAYMAAHDGPFMQQIDRFAERLAEHGDVSRAATEINASQAYGRVLLQRVIKRLGKQAR